MSTPDLARIAEALGSPRQKASGGFLCLCPAHDDRDPSLSLDSGDKGLVVRCMAGCEQDAVITAMRARGLWPGGNGRDHDMSPEDLARIEARRIEREQTRERVAAKAAKVAAAVWKHATEPDAWATNPYLERKQVAPTDTLREIGIDRLSEIIGYHPQASGEPLAGWVLVAPVEIDGKLSSVEFVDEAGRKTALKGGRKSGGYWATGALPNNNNSGATLIIAEGVATALSIHQATRHVTLAALSCNNLDPLARWVRQQYPAADIVVCGDLGNGQQHAERAAQAIGARLALPNFDPDRPEGATDFNDLHVMRGIEEVKRQVEAATVVQVQEMAQQQEAPRERGFRLIPIKQLLTTKEKHQWLIKNIIEAETLVGLVGQPAAYKSFLALGWALSVAAGKEWHGRQVQQGATIYIAGEGRAGIRRRVKAWLLHHGIDREIPFFLSSSSADLVSELETIIGKIATVEDVHGRVALVVIDTLARNFGGGDENATQDMGQFISTLDKIKSRFGCAVVLVHHSGHGEQNRGRGSSVFRASLDFEYLLVRFPDKADNRVTLSCSKNKDDEPMPTAILEPVAVDLGEVDEDGQTITSLVLVSGGAVQAQRKRLTQSQQLCLDALQTILQPVDGVGLAGHVDAWRDKAYLSGICPTGAQDAKRKAFKRAIQGLQSAGLIGCKDPYYPRR